MQKLAATAVQTLALTYNLPVDPRDPLPHHAFYGPHLRTESDAQNAG